MAVEFILGTSGSGKTTRCISSIIDELTDNTSDAPLVLLTPEQATYQAERTILTSGRICGFSRLKVLSFNRLEFLLSSGGADGKDISRLGKEMVVHKLLGRCGTSYGGRQYPISTVLHFCGILLLRQYLPKLPTWNPL